jgi:PhnB protein
MVPTTLAPFLSVRNGARAVDFYKSAFGAEEIFRHEDPSGATIVCPIRTEHAWRIGRVLDPFGHHWEIGKPHQKT